MESIERPHSVYITEKERAISLFSQSSTLFEPISGAEDLADTLTLPGHNAGKSSLDIVAQHYSPKPGPRPYTHLRYVLLNTYRRLFSVVFISNAIAFIILMIRVIGLLDLVNAAAANLLVSGLTRQPLVVNTLFKYGSKVPKSAPLRLRMLAAKVFHYGGVHSGAGVASCMWYIAFVGVLTSQYVHSPSPRPSKSGAVLALAWVILLLLGAIIIAAYPRIRMKFHDYFELTHRFAGWLVIILFWSLILIYASQESAMGPFLLRQPTFWILIILTLAIIHPWLLLRRIPIRAEPLSRHAIRLHFTHTSVTFGQGLSVSRHPLRDWHSFATFPDCPPTSSSSPFKPFSMVVSKAGDWTTSLINHPPTHLYKRGIPIRGFAYVMRMFTSIILVTTGSGIGPCLSFLGLPETKRPRIKLIWQTRSPSKTYGDGIIDAVHQLDPDLVIIDTSAPTTTEPSEGGSAKQRLDMLPLVLQSYWDFGAEVVCVISNPKLTGDLVYRLECRKVPAYGPIFDS